MVWTLFFLIALVFFVSGAIVTYLFIKREEKKKASEEESTALTNIGHTGIEVQLFKEEWQTTIQTQMHFNDLIIRFRSIVLTVFIAGVGLIFSAEHKAGIKLSDFNYLVLFAVVFWICCFLLDVFYYNRLLLGSVEHAAKFDNEPFFKERGFFGLTSSISKHVNSKASQVLIYLFYLLPIVFLVGVLLVKYYNGLGAPT